MRGVLCAIKLILLNKPGYFIVQFVQFVQTNATFSIYWQLLVFLPIYSSMLPSVIPSVIPSVHAKFGKIHAVVNCGVQSMIAGAV